MLFEGPTDADGRRMGMSWQNVVLVTVVVDDYDA